MGSWACAPKPHPTAQRHRHWSRYEVSVWMCSSGFANQRVGAPVWHSHSKNKTVITAVPEPLWSGGAVGWSPKPTCSVVAARSGRPEPISSPLCMRSPGPIRSLQLMQSPGSMGPPQPVEPSWTMQLLEPMASTQPMVRPQAMGMPEAMGAVVRASPGRHSRPDPTRPGLAWHDHAAFWHDPIRGPAYLRGRIRNSMSAGPPHDPPRIAAFPPCHPP